MALKVYKPINSSTRGLINIDRSMLWKGRPDKSLVKRVARKGGRNNYGRITVRHRGGGAKKIVRIIRKVPFSGKYTAARIEYDPGRSAHIALMKNEQDKFYTIAPEGIKAGDEIDTSEIRVGSCMRLGDIPSGTKVYNLELRPGIGPRAVRAAGTCARTLGVDNNIVSVRLPSGIVKKLHRDCTAVIGAVSNSDHMNRQHAKAGRNRNMGWKPVVRGTAMNARDHKHGGGRGKSKGCHPVSPTGVPAKGFKTRKKSKPKEFRN